MAAIGFQKANFRFQKEEQVVTLLTQRQFVHVSFRREPRMQATDLRKRTKDFALRVVRLSAALPRNREGDVLGHQLLRAGTSIGSNYREALRASSRRQFIYSVEIALREADESAYWLELLADSAIVPARKLEPLMSECKELVAILAATVKTSKHNLHQPRRGSAKSG